MGRRMGGSNGLWERLVTPIETYPGFAEAQCAGTVARDVRLFVKWIRPVDIEKEKERHEDV